MTDPTLAPHEVWQRLYPPGSFDPGRPDGHATTWPGMLQNGRQILQPIRALAEAVARWLGHRRFVALGTSRKFWYDEGLSVPLRSITSPGGGAMAKRLYPDPRMLPLLSGRRALLIDDVMSSGASLASRHRAGLTAESFIVARIA